MRLRHLLHSYDDACRTRLAGLLIERCQHELVAPMAERIDGSVRSEVAAMRALLAESGAMSALAALPETSVGVEGLEVRSETSSSRRLAGRGLTLVPALFAGRPSFFERGAGPVLVYPAPWEVAAGGTGRPRSLLNPTPHRIAELLLSTPRRTSDLAATLGISRPAVSQHLRTLKDAGIVRSDQDRRHELTPAGTAFLAL